ncbi:MAG: sodium pump decarboxylase gamma subunit [Lachnospiraceae bacterium]|nr:sodium pump decarboxylase gamma subunit [Lachnospiraceae bacterium]
MSIEVLQALDIMWKGMLGIFVALVIIMAFVWIMAKLGTKKEK